MAIHFQIFAEVDAMQSLNKPSNLVDFEVLKASIRHNKMFDTYAEALQWLEEHGFEITTRDTEVASRIEQSIRYEFEGK